MCRSCRTCTLNTGLQELLHPLLILNSKLIQAESLPMFCGAPVTDSYYALHIYVLPQCKVRYAKASVPTVSAYCLTEPHGHYGVSRITVSLPIQAVRNVMCTAIAIQLGLQFSGPNLFVAAVICVSLLN